MTDLHIVCLNGAPGTGKDTAQIAIATALKNGGIYRHIKFAEAIDNGICAFLPAQLGEHFIRLRHDPDKKNTEHVTDHGKTAREIMIQFSEHFAKPAFGEDIFGKIAAETLLEDVSFFRDWVAPENSKAQILACVSDCGFQAEFDAFCAAVVAEVPDAKIHLIHLTRTGHDFSNDSRQPVKPNNMTATYTEFGNNGMTAEQFQQSIRLTVKHRIAQSTTTPIEAEEGHY